MRVRELAKRIITETAGNYSAPRRLVIAIAMLTMGVFTAGVVYAQSGDGAGSYDEAEAQDIDRMLMCPVCPAQTIDQTEVPLAKQMRAQVRELLAAGATREEVLAWFAAPERYGPSVLAEPPRSGFYLIAWIVPGVVVVAGLAGGLLTLRAMRRRAGGGDGDAAADVVGETDDLQPYLDAVDRDLALDGNDSMATRLPRCARNDTTATEEQNDG